MGMNIVQRTPFLYDTEAPQQNTYLELRESYDLKNKENMLNEQFNANESYDNSFLSEEYMTAVLNKSKINITIDMLYEQTTEKLFTDVLTDVFFNAIPLDDDFKQKFNGNIKLLLIDNIKNLGEDIFDTFDKIKSNSDLLQNITKMCETTARDAVNNEEKKDDILNNEFVLNQDDKGVFDEKKDELNLDSISEVIKDKVVEVIKDETEADEKSKEMIDTIMDSAPSDDVTVQESYIRQSNDKSYSLFKAISINCHKNALKESVEVLEGEDEDIEKEVDIDMDLVLAESITRYTLLEMLHTMKIINLDGDKIRALSESLVNM